MTIQSTINSIRKSIEEESVSWGELAQLQDIAQSHPRLFRDDPRLAEWAGITERTWRNL
jgi:hypothetical protein